MRFGVLGPLEVVGQAALTPERPSHRRLLSILLLEPGRVIETDRLLDRLWHEAPPPTAKAALQVHVSQLRKRLGEGVIATVSAGYRLDLEGHSLDSAELASLLAQCDVACDRADWLEALDAAERAQLLWRGRPFEDLGHDDFAAPEIHRLDVLRTRIAGRLITALGALGRHGDAAELARREVLGDPLDERRWRHLMLELHLDGRSAEALRAYEEARRVLADELGVEPGATVRDLERRIRQQDPDLGMPIPSALLHNLPPRQTSYVGREPELVEVGDLLANGRVVTIVGAPGIGKTRLAVEIGFASGGRFPDGVWFVPLAAARTDQDVAGAIALATRARHQVHGLEDLARHLAPRQSLLILDNAEHLVEAVVAFLDGLARTEGPLAALITSRRPTGAIGERTYVLGPLRLGSIEDDAGSPTRALTSPAVRLFVDRARAADAGFRLLPETLPIVREVCAVTEGIPLALELAASWMPVIGIADVRDVLGPELAGNREPPGAMSHDASIGRAIDRSTSMLTRSDRRLLSRIAVFSGTFSLQDATSVCAPDIRLRDVAAAIARLVDVSLLHVDRRPEGRAVYRLLAPIREHVRVVQELEVERVAPAFLDHYLDKARAWSPDPLAAGVDFAGFDDEIDNVRTALHLALEGGRGDDVATAVVAVVGYFYDRYLAWEALDWLTRSLPLITDAVTLGWTLRCLGSLSQNVSDLESAQRYLAQSLRKFRRLGHAEGIAMSLLSIAQVHSTLGRWAAVRRAAQRALDILGPDGNVSGRATAHYYVGEGLAYDGREREAIPALRDASRLYRESGQDHRAAYVLTTLVTVSMLAGFKRPARHYAPIALGLARRSGSDYRLARALAATAAVEAAWGDAEAARVMVVEANARIGPNESDTIVEFLLPAGFVLRRLECWDWLIAMLGRAEIIAAELRVAPGAGWTDRIDRWRRQAPAGARDTDESAAVASMTVGEMAARTAALVGAWEMPSSGREE